MQECIPQFGKEAHGHGYVLRAGGYGVVCNHAGWIAVVKTPAGIFLPGGGQEPGEAAEAALIREAFEECGLAVRILRCLGVADELVFAQEERTYFRKRCTFFSATGQSAADRGSEPDHELFWLPADEAIVAIVYESQRWAVRMALSQGTIPTMQ